MKKSVIPQASAKDSTKISGSNAAGGNISGGTPEDGGTGAKPVGANPVGSTPVSTANSSSGASPSPRGSAARQDESNQMKNRPSSSTAASIGSRKFDSANFGGADPSAANPVPAAGSETEQFGLPRSLEDAVYSEMTRNIRVSVQPEYLADQSEPARASYAFQYTVTIENLGAESVQLLSRHWRINSGGAEYMQVKGDGVVGEQPTLQMSHGFRYTSGTVIKDPVGSMRGSYTFRSATGEMFDVEIPRFDLIYPHLLH